MPRTFSTSKGKTSGECGFREKGWRGKAWAYDNIIDRPGETQVYGTFGLQRKQHSTIESQGECLAWGESAPVEL